MLFVLIGVGAMLAVVGFFLFRKPAARDLPLRPAMAPAPGAARVATAAPVVPIPAIERAPVPVVAAPMPEALAGFQFIGPAELGQEALTALLARIGKIPRPPRALQQLVSPEFLADANSAQLSDLVMGEPQIAAKVLAVVNSAFYGLPKPVGSVGQAITFIGISSVRGICLEYLLNESFTANNPEIRRIFSQIWSASALASELCVKLTHRLRMSDPGAMVTQVVLSFLGQLAANSLLPRETVLATATQSLLERTRMQQAQLGLSGTEIGGLLMQHWGLPNSIVEDVRSVDMILVKPFAPHQAAREQRLALCYLCARLGERLAAGTLTDIASYDPLTDESADFYHLQGYLRQPGIQRVVEFLHFPEIVSSVNTMRGSLATRG